MIARDKDAAHRHITALRDRLNDMKHDGFDFHHDAMLNIVAPHGKYSVFRDETGKWVARYLGNTEEL